MYDKVAAASVKTIESHLYEWTEGILKGEVQDDAKSTHYPRRKPEDGLFSFKEKTALEIYNFIRGQAKPYPGAFFIQNRDGVSKRVYVWKARVGEKILDGEYMISCKDDQFIFLQRVQEEGKIEMWAKDYFNSVGGDQTWAEAVGTLQETMDKAVLTIYG